MVVIWHVLVVLSYESVVVLSKLVALVMAILFLLVVCVVGFVSFLHRWAWFIILLEVLRWWNALQELFLVVFHFLYSVRIKHTRSLELSYRKLVQLVIVRYLFYVRVGRRDVLVLTRYDACRCLSPFLSFFSFITASFFYKLILYRDNLAHDILHLVDEHHSLSRTLISRHLIWNSAVLRLGFRYICFKKLLEHFTVQFLHFKKISELSMCIYSMFTCWWRNWRSIKVLLPCLHVRIDHVGPWFCSDSLSGKRFALWYPWRILCDIQVVCDFRRLIIN